MNTNTRYLTLAAMLTAMGLLFPVLFHGLGLGSVFLPMFWPIVAGSFLLPLYLAVAIAFVTPVLSYFLTGMPPISPPILYLVIAELAVINSLTSILYQRFRFGIFPVLFIGLMAGRLFLFILTGPLVSLFGLPPKLASFGFVLQGVPGIVAMLVVIPILIGRIKHEQPFAEKE